MWKEGERACDLISWDIKRGVMHVQGGEHAHASESAGVRKDGGTQ